MISYFPINFYPRSHVGNDMLYASAVTPVILFLSTFPRRERLEKGTLLPGAGYFYPRSHVGNDGWEQPKKPMADHFYPRSHVGNDTAQEHAVRVVNGFLSTFPRRERPGSTCLRRAHTNFYPRSHVGNDRYYRMGVSRWTGHFYPRSHVGNDRNSFCYKIFY